MKFDRKKKILIIAAAVIMAAGAIGTAVYVNVVSSGDAKDHKLQSESIKNTADNDTGSDSGENSKGEKADKNSVKSSDEESGSDGFLPGGTGSLNVVPDVVINLNQEKESDTEDSVQFPYSINDTKLSVEKITSYDGIFIEDGSDQEVSGIAALVLKNGEEKDVEYTEITVKQVEDTLTFRVSAIPAGATVVILEADSKKWTDKAVTQIYASVSDGSDFNMSEEQIKIEDNGDDSITITNITNKDIPCIRIFYKYKLKDSIYVGGITYTAKITELKAGAKQNVRPSHYVSGASEVLMARIYESDN